MVTLRHILNPFLLLLEFSDPYLCKLSENMGVYIQKMYGSLDNLQIVRPGGLRILKT